MRYYTALAIGLISALALIALSSAASKNLLRDGDFSAASNPGLFSTYAKGAVAIPGWIVTKASVDLIGTYWTGPGGARSIDLDGTPGFGAIAQTFRTIPGKVYTVNFLLSGNAAAAPTIKHLRVSAAGRYADFSFNASSGGAQQGHWLTQTWKFVATRPWTTLQFASMDTTGGYCGPAIANISVIR